MMTLVLQAIAAVMLALSTAPKVAAAPVLPVPVTVAARPAPVTRRTTAPRAPSCQTAPPGWVAWYPGQTAPYVLYGSTVDGQLHYSAPAGYVVLVYRDGSQGATVMHTLAEWCRP